MADVKIFSTQNCNYLADKIAKKLSQCVGDSSTQKFSDGEFQPVYNESIRGDNVFLVQSTSAPADNLLELLLLIDAAKRASAGYITAVIPYFGFGRQDRKDRPRVAIGAKLIANLLTTSGADRIITMDLHAPQIQGFFDIPVDHLDSSAVFIPHIEQELQPADFIFASPDIGSANRVRSIASYFDVEMVICDKQRKKANEVENTNVIGNVEGKNVILIDDICDTGSSLVKSSEKLIEKGAKSVRAMCTHPVLSGSAYDRITNSVLTELIVCDTIPLKQENAKIKVLSVSSLFAQAIKNASENKSITNLFKFAPRKHQ